MVWPNLSDLAAEEAWEPWKSDNYQVSFATPELYEPGSAPWFCKEESDKLMGRLALMTETRSGSQKVTRSIKKGEIRRTKQLIFFSLTLAHLCQEVVRLHFISKVFDDEAIS